MVVLHENAVVHPHAVVGAAAAETGVLLKHSQAGSRLSRIENKSLVTLYGVNEL
jgi:hypothetical protein